MNCSLVGKGVVIVQFERQQETVKREIEELESKEDGIFGVSFRIPDCCAKSEKLPTSLPSLELPPITL